MDYIKSVFNKQKEFFNLGKTNNINFRIDTLKELKQIIKINEERILEALKKDLGKSNFESYATDPCKNAAYRSISNQYCH